MQVVVLVGQVADLQPFEQILDVPLADEHRRHSDQGWHLGRQTPGEIQLRQRFRHDQHRHQPVHQGDGELACAQHERDGNHRHGPSG